MEDLKKHLGRDEKVMMDILPQLKKAGLTEAKRGILTEAKHIFLDFLKIYTEQGHLVNANRWPKYAPKAFVEDPRRKQLQRTVLALK